MQCMNMCLLCSPWRSKPSKRRCWAEELAEQIPRVFSRLHRFSPPHELQLRQGHNDALGGALCWRRHIAVQRIHSHHAVLGLVVLEYEASRGKWGKHDKSNKKSKKEPAAINRWKNVWHASCFSWASRCTKWIAHEWGCIFLPYAVENDTQLCLASPLLGSARACSLDIS